MTVFFALRSEVWIYSAKHDQHDSQCYQTNTQENSYYYSGNGTWQFKKTFFRDHVLFEIGVTFLNS